MRTTLAVMIGLAVGLGTQEAVSAQSVYNPEVRTAVGSVPLALDPADLNGDGFVDLAGANFIGETMSVLLGTGSGNLNNAVSYPVGHRPRDVASADFDSDGDLDLAVIQDIDMTLDLLLNDGTSAMTKLATVPGATGSLRPTRVATGDLNADGLSDLVVLVPGPLGQASAFYLLTNLGGTGPAWLGFSSPVSLPIVVSFGFISGLSDIVVADVTGDGLDDIVAPRQGFFFVSGGSNIYTFPGDGVGGILPAIQNYIGSNAGPVRVDLGDVDSDGDLDLVTADSFSGDISVLRNVGVDSTGSWLGFGLYLLSPPFPYVYSGAGAEDAQWLDHDLNGDGLLDILTISKGGTLGVMYSDPLAGFLYGGNAPVGMSPTDVALIDNAAVTSNSGSDDLSSIGLADLPLAATGSGNIGITGGGPLQLLEVNGSTGGSDRMVVVGSNQPITISLSYPVTNASGSAPFALWGRLGVPGPTDPLYVPGIGALSYPPCPLSPLGFTLADNIGTGTCAPLFASTPVTSGNTWNLTLPAGLSAPLTITLEGVAYGLSAKLQTTNSIILVVQ